MSEARFRKSVTIIYIFKAVDTQACRHPESQQCLIKKAVIIIFN